MTLPRTCQHLRQSAFICGQFIAPLMNTDERW